MPSPCCAPGCKSRLKKGGDIKMYRFPTKYERLDKWIKMLAKMPVPGQKSRRSDGLWEPKEHNRICSLHFVKGKPVKDPTDTDYIPTIFNHTPAKKNSRKVLQERMSRQNHNRPLDSVVSMEKSQVVYQAHEPMQKALRNITPRNITTKNVTPTQISSCPSLDYDIDLCMECVDDELSPAQLKAIQEAEKEHNKILCAVFNVLIVHRP